MYLIRGAQSVSGTDVKGVEYWKVRWNADNVLKNGNQYFFVQKIIDADFNDI
jgi:hypothetical protein